MIKKKGTTPFKKLSKMSRSKDAHIIGINKIKIIIKKGNIFQASHEETKIQAKKNDQNW